MNNTYLTKRKEQIQPLQDKMAGLKTEIATLQNQKTLSSLEVEETQKLLNFLSKDVTELNAEFLAGMLFLDEFIGFSKKIIDDGIKHIKETDSVLKQYLVVIASLDSTIKDKIAELERIKKERIKILENIQEEEKRISSSKRDLEIYKERLQAKAKELGVNILIRF